MRLVEKRIQNLGLKGGIDGLLEGFFHVGNDGIFDGALDGLRGSI